ncbi:hypothetical protein GCM10010106_45040 [Thermopolyspora flexuosa]|jgi:hypothetical protein|nr:hypothetical protein GCM10010106_45040 [Thermopolyspora flexuosa]
MGGEAVNRSNFTVALASRCLPAVLRCGDARGMPGVSSLWEGLARAPLRNASKAEAEITPPDRGLRDTLLPACSGGQTRATHGNVPGFGRVAVETSTTVESDRSYA